MKMWSIDDGATHTVVARDPAEAMGLYVTEVMKMGGDWPEEKPSVAEVDPHKDYTLHVDGGSQKVKMPGYAWSGLFSHPQYLGCSEW